MNIITHDADNKARQVVPQDFSFLSDADRQITAALSKILRTMFEVDDNSQPVFLGALNISSKEIPGAATQYTLGANVLMYQGMLYEMDKSPTMQAENKTEFLKNLVIYPTMVDSQPSPVYGEGLEQNIFVHKSLKMVYGYNAEGQSWKVSDLKVIPSVIAAGITINRVG